MLLKSVRPDSNASLSLDMMRSAAALLVLASHLRAIFFIHLDHIKLFEVHFTLLDKLFYFATSGEIAHESVIAFFVLSGYLVGGSVLTALQKGKWSWSEYLLQRLVRIYIVLIPALSLGLLWDMLSIHQQSLQHSKIFTFNSLGIISFLGNVLSIQGIHVPTYGSNAALWSLSYELWYYFAFPLLALLFVRNTKLRWRIAYLLAFIAILVIVGPTVALYGIIWLFGVIARWLYSVAVIDAKFRRWFLYGLVIGAFAYTGVEKIYSPSIADFPLGIVFAAIVWLASLDARTASQGIVNTVIRRLSKSSYTIYLTHMPFFFFLAIVFNNQQRMKPSPSSYLYGFGMLLVAFIYTQLVYNLFERNTVAVRLWIRRRFKKDGPTVLKAIPLEASTAGDQVATRLDSTDAAFPS